MSDIAKIENNLGNAAKIVAAFVANNAVPTTEIPSLIVAVHSAIVAISTPATAPAPETLVPAVPVKKSINPAFIVCLEDGKKFVSMRRHLNTTYGMTPEDYRAKWGLPHDYPMVAPDYAAKRSELAKSTGLGRSRTAKATKEKSATPERDSPRIVSSNEAEPEKAKRGRPRLAKAA